MATERELLERAQELIQRLLSIDDRLRFNTNNQSTILPPKTREDMIKWTQDSRGSIT